MQVIEIASRKIGPSQPCFIIAEAGVNHNGDITIAKKLIDAAADAGADAVKFQTFRADKIASSTTPKADYQKVTTGESETQFELLQRLELSQQAHRELKAYCIKKNILFISTPFDEESADFLDTLGVPLFKIGSGEITNLPLLIHVAQKGRPIILSTGMAFLHEVSEAVSAIRSSGNDQICLLQCVSNYPAEPGDANLRAMKTMSEALQVPAGYSDHTLGNEVSLAAVAMGACVIEKHFTLDKSMPGPDHRASADPMELSQLVEGIRKVEASLGHGRKEPAQSEANTAAVARKSLVASRDLQAGTQLSASDIDIKRPGNGLPPKMKPYLIGLTLRVPVKRGEVFSMEMFT